MKIFITGVLGFIGSHLARHHLKQGDEVWGLDNLSSGQKKHLEPLVGLKFDEGNLLEWPQLDKAVEWADGIYHMAAMVGQQLVLKAPFEVLTNNIGGCERILHSIIAHNKKCKLLIASSSEVYGHNKNSTFSEDEAIHFSSIDHVQANYALSKFVNEKMALAAVLEKDLHCVVARLFNTTGKGQTGRYGMVAPSFVRQAINNEPITIFGKGDQTRSFCDVRDMVHYLSALLVHPEAKGEIFNVGNDHEISIKELAMLVKKVTNSDSKIIHLSYKEAYNFDFQETPRRCPNLDKLRKFIRYTPRFSLKDTLAHIFS